MKFSSYLRTYAFVFNITHLRICHDFGWLWMQLLFTNVHTDRSRWFSTFHLPCSYVHFRLWAMLKYYAIKGTQYTLNITLIKFGFRISIQNINFLSTNIFFVKKAFGTFRVQWRKYPRGVTDLQSSKMKVQAMLFNKINVTGHGFDFEAILTKLYMLYDYCP